MYLLNRSSFLLAILTLWIPTVVSASTCGSDLLAGSIDLTAPDSVGNDGLADFVNSGPSWTEGVKVSIEEQGDELWVDVTEYPGAASLAAAVRIAWLIGRVSSGSHQSVVFSDEGKGLYVIDETTLAHIGCRFVVEQEGGENPIVLMREFYDALLTYEDKTRVAPEYNGSLLGDTNTALTVNNEVFVPGWVLSAIKY
jgi:hypothetical protein